METTQSLPTLRPLRLGELLDQAIRLYRANFLTFIGIIALIYIPLMVLQTAASALLREAMLAEGTPTGSSYISYAYIALLFFLVLLFVQYFLVQGIAAGALARAVVNNYLGKKTGILDAYREMGRSWLTILGALLLLGIILIGISIWGAIPCVGWFTGLGMGLFVMAVVNPFVPPAVVLEKQGAFDAIRRAWSLARRRFWPVLGYVFVLYLFSLIVVNGPSAIVSALLAQLPLSFGDSTLQLILTSVIQGIVSLVFVLIYLPLQLTALTLVYLDLRVRTEGFDLALLTLETSGSTDIAEVMAAPTPPANEPLITGTEFGNFAILTIAGLGLYILVFAIIMIFGIFILSASGI